jgi:enoyl-CoA hydratase
LPEKVAIDLMMTGRQITAPEALAIGAISRVATDGALDATVAELVDSLVAKSPAVLGIGKQSFYAASDLGFDAALDLLATGLTVVAMTEDAREGTTAFIEKRPPNFVGR